MHTSLRIDGANCPTCFNQTLDALAALEGVHDVHGSFAGPCIEVEHECSLDAISATVRNRLHGIEMFANEIRMVPLEPVAEPNACIHHTEPASAPAAAPQIDPSMTLGDIVTLRPGLAIELERHGLDYCCHGGRTLAAAADEAGLDAEWLAAALSGGGGDAAPADWATLTPVELAEHIEQVHHTYLWGALPRIDALVDKIAHVHGGRHPELATVQTLFRALRADLEPHLVSEEQRVFPLIRELASDPDPARVATATAQIDELTREHDTVGDLLEQLRQVTSAYVPPADGCATYTAAYAALAELEADTHLHVHKENNVLFPAVLAERSVPAGTV